MTSDERLAYFKEKYAKSSKGTATRNFDSKNKNSRSDKAVAAEKTKKQNQKDFKAGKMRNFEKAERSGKKAGSAKFAKDSKNAFKANAVPAKKTGFFSRIRSFFRHK